MQGQQPNNSLTSQIMKLSSEKRHHEKQQATDLLIWADWLLYRGYPTIFNGISFNICQKLIILIVKSVVVVEVIRKIEELGSQIEGVAVQRCDFVSFKQALINNFREPDYFQTLLNQLDSLVI